MTARNGMVATTIIPHTYHQLEQKRVNDFLCSVSFLKQIFYTRIFAFRILNLKYRKVKNEPNFYIIYLTEGIGCVESEHGGTGTWLSA